MNSSDERPTISRHQPTSQVFDLWAQVYDPESNPLLKLEERHLLPLLPPLIGCDVLDIGCGSGRWLCEFEKFDPASISGIDYSAVMLQRARKVIRKTTILHQGDCKLLPGQNESTDFALASFLLNYLTDIQLFAQECSRIIRPGGHLFISDMHPTTAAKFGWQHSFCFKGLTFEISGRSRSVQEIIAVFLQNGFDIQELIEPSFGSPEFSIFESAGKLESYEALTKIPAVYILRLRRKLPLTMGLSSHSTTTLELNGLRYATGPENWGDGTIGIEDERIIAINNPSPSTSTSIDLTGYLALPGLINAHDHLDFGLFPNLGRLPEAPYYRNSNQWAHDIHLTHSGAIARHLSVPKKTRLWWGAIRNLLSGVTTVCHHNPMHQDFELSDFPVRVVKQFRWAHSLDFDLQLLDKFNATSSDMPFIIHAAEGIDTKSRNEFLTLEHMRLLDKKTVIVHALAINSETVSLINQRGVSIIICPTSNHFLFSHTVPRPFLDSIKRLALGTDSPITAAGNLLDEIQFTHRKIGLDVASIYKMVTSNAADILRLQHGEGQLVESGRADLIAIRSQRGTPASLLSELTWDQIELVIRSGRVQMASSSLFARLPRHLHTDMELLDIAGHERWIRAPLRKLFVEAETVLGTGKLQIGGKQVRYLGAA